MSTCLSDPAPIWLWQGLAPAAVGDDEADKPRLMPYLPVPAESNGTSVIICPGGGYGHLCEDREGEAVAEWFRGIGVAAFVLRYRISPRYRHPTPLIDARRAVRTVRARSVEWALSPDRVGIMGFSAGGHLASTAGTLFEAGDATAEDPVERVSSRPDFMALAYPVITLKPPYAHLGSRRNLLGDSDSDELAEQLSTNTRVTADTPPTFLMHTDADRGVPSENSVLFYLALRAAGVPAEMHIYADGGHGIDLAVDHPTLGNWPERLRLWMRGRGLLGR